MKSRKTDQQISQEQKRLLSESKEHANRQDFDRAKGEHTFPLTTQQRLSLMTEAGRIGIWDLDLVHREMYMDDNCRSLFGFAPKDKATYELFLNNVHPDDRQMVEKAILQSMLESKGYSIEYRVKRPDGTIGWIYANGFRFFNEKGKCIRMSGVALDITEHKNSEQALRISEERYRGLVELSPEALYINRNNRIVFVNSAAVKLLGAESAEQIVGKSPYDIMHPDFHPIIRERIEQQLKTGKSVPIIEEKIIKLDGTAVDVEVTATPFMDKEGPAIQVILRDITERKKAEETRKQLFTIIESAQDFIGYADAKSKHIMYINNAGRKVCGIGEDEDVTKYMIWDVHPQWTNKILVETALPAAARDGVWTGECAFLNVKDKSEIPIQMVLMSHKGPGGEIEKFSTISRDITERKKAEETIRESEERFRAAFLRGSIPMVIAALDTRFTKVNPAFCRMLGFDEEELVNHSFTEFTHPDDMAANLAGLQQIISGQLNIFRMEKRYIRKDGSVIWGDMSTCAVLDAEGKAIYIVTHVQDITERKKAQEELAASEERYRVLVDRSPNAIFVHNTSEFLYVNPAGITLLGAKDSSEIAGKDPLMIIPEEYREIIKERMRRCEAEHKSNPTLELKIIRLDGKLIDVDGTSTGIFYRGKPAIQLIIRDITDRKRAERDLLRRNQQLISLSQAGRKINEVLKMPAIMRSLVASAIEITGAASGAAGLMVNGQMVFTEYNEHGKLLAIDYKFAKGYGVSGHIMETCQPYVSDDAEHDSHVIPEIQKALGFNNLANVPIISRTGELLGCFEIHNKPAKFDEQDVISLQGLAASAAIAIENAKMVDDINLAHKWMRKAQEELKGINEDLERRVRKRTSQLQALAMKLTVTEEQERQRLAVLLHDNLLQLLASAKLSLGTLNRSLEDSSMSKLADDIKYLLEESIKVSRDLTTDLSPPILRELGLVDTIGWLADLTKEKYGLTIELETTEQIKTEPYEVRVILYHAVKELLFNITKYAQVKTARIQISRTPDDMIKIVVSDNGIGFDKDKKIFHTDADSGFGLFSIRERLDVIGGRFEIDSAPGKGTCVTLIAPLSLPAVSKEPLAWPPIEGEEVQKGLVPAKAAGLTSKYNKIRVLIADDHKIMRDGIITVLSGDPDIEVVAQASDGLEAVELAQRLKPDVITMDISMPRLNGIEATRRITRDMPKVRVIVLSMYSEAELGDELKSSGAAAYVSKDSPGSILLAAIHSVAMQQV